MSTERRRAERVRVNLEVIFTDHSRQHNGRISDISVSGCFILSAVEAVVHEPVAVRIQLPTKKSVRLKGEVVYNTAEIGFAIHFTELPGPTLKFIEKLVKRLGEASRQPEQDAGH